MNNQAGVESNIRTATEMFKAASRNLRVSYNIASEHDELGEFRADVYNNAKLYQDKIIPFSSVAVVSVRELFEEVGNLAYEEFRQLLDIIIENAQSTEILCNSTLVLNKAILVKFKEIEDRVKRFTKRQSLDDEHEMLMSPVTATTYNTNKDELFQDSFMSNVVPLTISIENYIKSIISFSGILDILSLNLAVFKENAERAKHAALKKDNGYIVQYFHKRINNKTKDIISFCNNYISNQPKFMNNLDIISVEPNKRYIDEWIPNEMKEHNMYEKLKNILEDRPSLKLLL